MVKITGRDHKTSDSIVAMQHKDNQVLTPPRATDPGWAHGTMVNGGRQKIKCKYCHKIFLGGGISRLKQHLAGERGNVAPCEEVPEEVRVQIQQHLGFKVLEKLKRQKALKSENESFTTLLQPKEEGHDSASPVSVQNTNPAQPTSRRRGNTDGEGSSCRTKKRCKTPIDAYPIRQSFASQDIMDQADMAVARFMYDAGMPFAAANSSYFQQMADAIAAAGPGYRMPSYHSLRGKLLNRSFQDAGGYCEELKRSWEVTGCSVLVNRWVDRTGRTIVLFFVYCPKGTMFLKSFDVSDVANSTELLTIFDSIVQEIGPRNVVNFITDTSPSYRAAGKLLVEKYNTFFSTTCGVQCIEIILERVGQMEGVKDVLAKAKKITRFIYSNAWVLNLMRKKTGERDIIQLGGTRYVSIFKTLETILCLKDCLRQMFVSTAWMQSSFSFKNLGLEVAEILGDPLFWSFCDQTLKVTKPLLSVLHVMEYEERPCVGYVYDAMEKAKKNIIAAFDEQKSDYLPYLEVIEPIWQAEFCSPIHAAANYLNPAVFYSPSFSSNKSIRKGLVDCIETLEPDIRAQVMITNHINFYEESLGDFGRPVALRGRESLAPATWWSLYATDYHDLQRFAVRILSQTCCITQCKRSWSMFERIHLKSRNQVEQERLDDLIFVHFNLYLQERRWGSTKGNQSRCTLDPVCLELMDSNMGDWVENIGGVNGEETNWTERMTHHERMFVSNTDDTNESTDGGSSDVTKGIDGNND